ncbi:MAG TPA: alkaline phosphatase family protein, partial [Acidimicrobiia bacterium]|nr:alkaline phosphatase family protein [Acidimicrobiia bacterium]
MRRSIRRRLGMGLVAAVIAGGLAVPAAQGAAPSRSHHVLLISVDGLHDFDLNLWVAQHPESNLADLVDQGTTYNQASTSIPSDSFPGLLAMVTGGTPKSTGVFYDAAYDRSLYPPGSACQGPQGTQTVYDETIAKPDAAGHIPFSGGAIDPSRLPLRKVDDRCDPVQPRDFLKVNTIFGVAHAAGLRTAWSDKHPAYQIVEGPGTEKTVDDLFTPEINADVTPPDFPRPDLAITDWVPNTIHYDRIKVAAVRNQIDGLDSSGHTRVGVPAIFGMNFQAVSVAEKLVDPV